jgi:hypothetical protein
MLDFLRGRYGRPPEHLLAAAVDHEDDRPA